MIHRWSQGPAVITKEFDTEPLIQDPTYETSAKITICLQALCSRPWAWKAEVITKPYRNHYFATPMRTNPAFQTRSLKNKKYYKTLAGTLFYKPHAYKPYQLFKTMSLNSISYYNGILYYRGIRITDNKFHTSSFCIYLSIIGGSGTPQGQFSQLFLQPQLFLQLTLTLF